MPQFANVHDITWGTKGDNKVATDLGVVKTDAKSNAVEVDAPTDRADIDAAYDTALQILHSKPIKEAPKKDMEQENKDYYQAFRTRVLLFWTLSNVSVCVELTSLQRKLLMMSKGLLAAIVTAATDTSSVNSAVSGYMAFILYSVAGLACAFLLLVCSRGDLYIYVDSHPFLWFRYLSRRSHVRRRVESISVDEVGEGRTLLLLTAPKIELPSHRVQSVKKVWSRQELALV